MVAAVSKAEQSFGAESTEASVAKSIAILQILNNLPATEHNIAALMHPSVDADSLLDPVIEALKKLEGEHQSHCPARMANTASSAMRFWESNKKNHQY